MKKKVIIPIILVVVLVIAIFAFNFSNKNKISPEDEELVLVQGISATGNPAGGYCRAMGYRPEYHESGGSYCILPDEIKCEQWAFYRGKCGQEWSYCIRRGYDLKDLGEREGWLFDGSVCLDKDTKEEIGTVYDLINEAVGITE